MAAQPNTTIPLVDRMKQEMRHRIAQELTRARDSSQRFVTLQHRPQDGNPHEFLQCVVDVANSLEVPPYAIAPFGDASGAKTDRAVVCTVIVSF